MTEEIRQKIALERYKLISPVLAEPTRKQNTYFRSVAEQEHLFPHYGPRKYRLSAYKHWLRMYRKQGIEGLKPKARTDKGRPRYLNEESLAAILGKCKAYPGWTVAKLYESLLTDNQLGLHPPSYNTLLRTLKQQGISLGPAHRTDVRKRYEVEMFGELWLCDFMHGPEVKLSNQKMAKAILCAIIDDHTRMIVGHAFSAHETISSLTLVLKDALGAFGIPRRFYVDNGSAFSCDLLVQVCARLGISLIHSKPYDSPSRGKIERFLRTVRECFLSGIGKGITMEELDHAFYLWLNDQYHHKVHAGIDCRPIDRYHTSATQANLRHLSRAELDEVFLVRAERIVGNDATISFKSRIYEVPGAYIRQRIEVRHPVDNDSELYLYDQGARIAKLKVVDVNENSRTFRPTSNEPSISFSKSEVWR